MKTILAHPVALEEVRPWLYMEMPSAVRKPAASGGAAAQEVARATENDLASMGPPEAAKIYGLVPLVNGIEEGPHNVTRWWVIGRQGMAPTGNDKTTLLLSTSEGSFGKSMGALFALPDKVLTVYERPTKRTLDTHRYVLEVGGHTS